MHNRSTYRTGNWLALLASVVFVSWPGLVRGSCCCEAKQQVSSIASAVDATSCCETESSCRATTDDSASKSCCSESSDGLVGCSSDTEDHQCGVSCCQALTAIAVRSIQPNKISSFGLLLVEARIEFPAGIEVRSSDLPDLPLRFLLAQDHCAQICSWLK